MGAWGDEAPPNFLAFLCEAYIAHSAQHTIVYDMQGWRSRSGRPSNRRTNVLTESDVANPSLVGEKHAYCQHRFVPPRISQSKHKRDLRTSRLWAQWQCTHFWWVLLELQTLTKCATSTMYWQTVWHTSEEQQITEGLTGQSWCQRTFSNVYEDCAIVSPQAKIYIVLYLHSYKILPRCTLVH